MLFSWIKRKLVIGSIHLLVTPRSGGTTVQQGLKSICNTYITWFKRYSIPNSNSSKVKATSADRLKHSSRTTFQPDWWGDHGLQSLGLYDTVWTGVQNDKRSKQDNHLPHHEHCWKSTSQLLCTRSADRREASERATKGWRNRVFIVSLVVLPDCDKVKWAQIQYWLLAKRTDAWMELHYLSYRWKARKCKQ